jgi:hypothetical protein
MLQRLREHLTLALLILLPFHAFIVTVMTKMILGSGRAPFGLLALWKEGILGVIIGMAMLEIFRNQKPETRNQCVDVMDVCILFLLGISVVLLTINHASLIVYLYGFKYDFIPLIAFLILRRVPWTEVFIASVLRTLLITGGIVAAYGIVTLVLPSAYFSWLGYSDAHSLYIPGSPIAAFQKIGGSNGILRMQSTFSGPNQMGLWLLIPWICCFVNILRGRSINSGKFFTLIVLLSMGIIFSFSRSAWIGAAVAGTIASFVLIPAPLRKTLGLIAVSFTSIVVASVLLVFPQVFFRTISNQGHIDRPIAALQKIWDHPLGMGIGTAGPASNRTSDPCVFLPGNSTLDWLQPGNSPLCVFLGNKQTVPEIKDRLCHCAFLPENWYLQIGVEMGIVGMVLWIVITMSVLQKLWVQRTGVQNILQDRKSHDVFRFGVFLSFLALSIAALFLHAFEDSAVAYTVWILIAAISSTEKMQSNSVQR